MAQNCWPRTEHGKKLKQVIGKRQSLLMDPVLEPDEEIQLDFAGPIPDELNKNVYLLVAIDNWSKFSTGKGCFKHNSRSCDQNYDTFHFN